MWAKHVYSEKIFSHFQLSSCAPERQYGYGVLYYTVAEACTSLAYLNAIAAKGGNAF